MTLSPCVHVQVHENDCMLRSRETHSAQCAELHGPLYDHFSTTYGLSCDSILNHSKYFHVVDGMVPDIMHDILEGCLQMLLKYILKYFVVQMKFFTVDTLNARLHSFHFGSADSANRPSPITLDMLTSRAISVRQSCKLLHVQNAILYSSLCIPSSFTSMVLWTISAIAHRRFNSRTQ